MKSKTLGVLIFACVCTLFLIITTQQINLTGEDLGRHLANGRTLLENGFWKSPVFSKNLFSYTHPDFPFVNHHWGTGLIFFALVKFFGFNGISIFYSLLSFTTFLIFFHLAYLLFKWSDETKYSWLKASLMALLVLPLVSSRAEIRPEGFSSFFLSIFYWLLIHRKYRKIPRSVLWILPIIMIFWVNLHVYFFIGICLVLAFLLDECVSAWRDQTDLNSDVKTLSLILIACGAATLINPVGIHLSVFPFLIFKNYGYKVAENQSVPFFLNRRDVPISGLDTMVLLSGVYTFFIARIIYYKVSERRMALKNHSPKFTSYTSPLPIAELLVTSFIFLMGFFAVRNLSLVGYFALPGLASMEIGSRGFRKRGGPKNGPNFWIWASLILISSDSLYSFYKQSWDIKWSHFGLGLMPGVGGAGEFILKNKLKENIFNNYDIGSYLTYYLYPGTRVFVDNRPEAYPTEFFTRVYVPMQESEAIWKVQAERFKLNTIVFYWHDLTPWGQSFMISRAKDPEWIQVYQDSFSIIWVRRVVNSLTSPTSMAN